MASDRAAELPPHHAKEPVPWVKLMHLQRIDANTFRSTCRAFDPLGDRRHGARKQAYGGHVYAQAMVAASMTLPCVIQRSATSASFRPDPTEMLEVGAADGFVCHSVTGYFTLPASSELPFVYTVRRVRDGKGFCVRTVEVVQLKTEGVCFTSTVSFKRYEASQIEFQDEPDLDKQYNVVLTKENPWDYADMPSTEGPWLDSYEGPPFPGLITKKVEMAVYNSTRTSLDKRQLSLYTVVGKMPRYKDDPNLHVAAHLYASDRNSLFTVSRHLGVNDNYKATASLTHTVVLHTTGPALSLLGRWFMQEAWTDRFGDGRGVHHSRIWNRSSQHLATTLQDGLIRLHFKDNEEWKEKKEAAEGKSRL